jgi:mercuric ion binding protein
MKRFLIIAASILALEGGFLSAMVMPSFAVEATSAQTAAVQTATFTIENMTCALCPVTVKSAMAGADGVTSVTINFEAKTAMVVFNPSITTLEAIAAASADAGYPATARN